MWQALKRSIKSQRLQLYIYIYIYQYYARAMHDLIKKIICKLNAMIKNQIQIEKYILMLNIDYKK